MIFDAQDLTTQVESDNNRKFLNELFKLMETHHMVFAAKDLDEDLLYMMHDNDDDTDVERDPDIARLQYEPMSDSTDYFGEPMMSEPVFLNARQAKRLADEARFDKAYNTAKLMPEAIKKAKFETTPNPYNLNLASLNKLKVVDQQLLDTQFEPFGKDQRVDINQSVGHGQKGLHHCFIKKQDKDTLVYFDSISRLPRMFYDESQPISPRQLDLTQLVVKTVTEWLDAGYVTLLNVPNKQVRVQVSDRLLTGNGLKSYTELGDRVKKMLSTFDNYLLDIDTSTDQHQVDYYDYDLDKALHLAYSPETNTIVVSDKALPAVLFINYQLTYEPISYRKIVNFKFVDVAPC